MIKVNYFRIFVKFATQTSNFGPRICIQWWVHLSEYFIQFWFESCGSVCYHPFTGCTHTHVRVSRVCVFFSLYIYFLIIFFLSLSLLVVCYWNRYKIAYKVEVKCASITLSRVLKTFPWFFRHTKYTVLSIVLVNFIAKSWTQAIHYSLAT